MTVTKPTMSHIGPGYAFGGERAQIMAKRLAYVKKHGSAWLLRGERPPAPGWPRMPTAAPRSHSRKADPAKRAQMKALVAETVAEGGFVKDAAPLLGVSVSYCGVLWREIVQDLGWQAS